MNLTDFEVPSLDEVAAEWRNRTIAGGGEITLRIQTRGDASPSSVSALSGTEIGEGSAIRFAEMLDNGDVEMRLGSIMPGVARAWPMIQAGISALVYLGLTWVAVDVTGDLTSEDSHIADNLSGVGAGIALPLVAIVVILYLIG